MDSGGADGPITADSILKSAYERKKPQQQATKVDILDLEELKDWQRRKRTEFETVLKRNRLDIRQWMRYARFEADHNDIRRARSVYERALLVDHGFIPLWIQYIDSELKWKNVNHARNLLDRATNLLPRVDKLWYKYVFLEEALGNVGIVRGIFTRWCSLEPGPNAWDSFVEFELRQSDFENVRNVYSKYVLVHPQVSTWLQWVRFEHMHGDASSVRTVYSMGLDTLTAHSGTPLEDIEQLIESFASWEAEQDEIERARSLYRIALERWPDSHALKEQQVKLEKKFGSSGVEDAVIEKRKAAYEEELESNHYDYSTWWVYLDLLESKYPREVRQAFDKFVDMAQPTNSKTKDMSWKRYVKLCIRYLVYLELTVDDLAATRQLFQRLLDKIIPNKRFTFGKLWIMYAEFEIRQNDLTRARKILGMSLGKCPKPKTFKYYINMEMKLKEFDRVRRLYEKYLDFNPENVQAWLDYAELEENLGDEDRSRAIYKLSLSNSVGLPLNDQLAIFQRFIAFETDASEYDNARALYNEYLILSEYDVNVWINWALFESTIPSQEQLIAYQEAHEGDEDEDEDEEEEEFTFDITDENKKQTRDIFEKAIAYFKERQDAGKVKQLLESLLEYEMVHGTEETVSKTKQRMPKTVKRKTIIDGIEQEVFVLELPEEPADEINKVSKNLLERARQWQQENSK